MLGRRILGIGSAAEGIKIGNIPTLQGAAEILPLAHIVAQLTGNQTTLQEAIQLHTHLVTAGIGAAAQAALITENDQRVFRNVIHCGSHFRINQSHISVGSRIAHPIFVFF